MALHRRMTSMGSRISCINAYTKNHSFKDVDSIDVLGYAWWTISTEAYEARSALSASATVTE